MAAGAEISLIAIGFAEVEFHDTVPTTDHQPSAARAHSRINIRSIGMSESRALARNLARAMQPYTAVR